MKKKALPILLGVLGLVLAGFLFFYIRVSIARAEGERTWKEANYAKITDLGAVDELAVLPLVDLAVASPDLAGERGVSYLVRAGSTTLLFDVGYNVNGEDPSPVQRNIESLDISLDDIDTIMISHDHPDHVGGMMFQFGSTFSLGKEQVNLGSKQIYTPIKMSYPGQNPIYTQDPTVIAPGMATMGVIPFAPYYPETWMAEQSLAIHVQGHGIVIITGCGHPGLEKLLARADMLFDQPVVGIIGGLHYFTNDFMDLARADVERLREHDLELIALSPHDSVPAALELYEQAFPEIIQVVTVGEEIHIK